MGNKVNRNDRGLQKPGAFCNIKRGYFDINGKKMFFRSKWEANYACYLDFLVKQKQIKKWEYEPDCFIFEEIKFGTRSYRPDFKVTNNDGSVIYRFWYLRRRLCRHFKLCGNCPADFANTVL